MPPKKPVPKPVKKKKEIELKLRHILNREQKKLDDLYAFWNDTYLSKGEDIPVDVFGAAAKKMSECPSAKKDGQLGWFGKGKLEDDFEKHAFCMREKTVCEPFKGSKGFHIIYVEQSREK
ncbi:Foldase protein PrsA [Diplonema papillatum]|nr:Foldase protein PrsA [Diplonema papillatum]